MYKKLGFCFMKIVVRDFWCYRLLQTFTKSKTNVHPPDGMMESLVFIGIYKK
jgi:hypothetical protein